MLDDYKKYFPHLVSLLFLLNIILMLLFRNSGALIFFGFVVIVSGLIIIGESLYYIVKVKSDDIPVNIAIAYPLILLFGVFYNPCLSLRYFEEDEDYKKKNIIFLIISIVLAIIGIVLFVNSKMNSVKLKDEYTTWNDTAVLKIPEGYKESKATAGDLNYYKNDHEVSLRTLDRSDLNEYMDSQREFIMNNIDNPIVISDDTKTKDNKTIRKIVIEGSTDNIHFVHVLAGIQSSSQPDKIINIYQYCYEYNYASYEDVINKIIDSTDVK